VPGIEKKERVWLAREAVRALAKAVKVREAHDASHASARSALEELARSVANFVRAHGPLRLAVTRETLLHGAERTYEAGKRERNLATELFLGGVRELSFGPGADREVDPFVVALTSHGERDDLVARVWEQDLQAIEVTGADDLIEELVASSAGLSPESLKAIRDLNERVDALVASIGPTLPAGGGIHELTDGAGELSLLDKVRATPAPPGPPIVEAEALETCARVAESLDGDALLVELASIVLDGLAVAPDDVDLATATWFLEAAPPAALRSGNLRLLARLLERYTMELTARGGEVSALIAKLVEGFAEEHVIEKLAALASGGALGGPTSLCEIFELLGEHMLASAVTAYLRDLSPDVRAALDDFLVENLVVSPRELQRALQPQVAADVARSAMFVYGKAPIPEIEIEGACELAKTHPEARVREHGELVLRTRTARGRLQAFKDALEAKDPQERIRAAGTLTRAQDHGALETLLKLIEDPSFLSREFEEMDAFIAAVVAIGGERTKHFLEQQSSRTTGVFKMRAGTHLRDAAKKALDDLAKGQEGAAP
jgi:hypothetical protein